MSLRLDGCFAALVCGVLAACGSERPVPMAPPAPVPEPKAAAVASQQRSSLVVRRAQGTSKEQSLTLVTHAVKTALVSQRWVNYVPEWQPTLPTRALTWHSQTDVELALDAPEVERWLTSFEAVVLDPQAPSTLREPLLEALTSERSFLVCQQRQALLARPCAMLPPRRQREALAAALSRTVLEPDWPDGVPAAADGRVLWPARLRVWERGEQGLTALEGMPLRVEWCMPEQAAAPRIARSDSTGLAQLTLAESWERVGVKVASEDLLGPLSGVWPSKTLELQTRRVDRSRLAAVIVERARGRAAGTHVMAPSILGELGTRLEREPISLPEDVLPLVSSAQSLTEQAVRVRIAEATQGQTDYVLLVQGDSEFASRMGTGRIWYEARAEVQLVEVWTGTVVESFSLEHAEAGIGEARADEAARIGLAVKIARRLSEGS